MDVRIFFEAACILIEGSTKRRGIADLRCFDGSDYLPLEPPTKPVEEYLK